MIRLWPEIGNFDPLSKSDSGSELAKIKQSNALTVDQVSKQGLFWVYERIIRMPYYGIYQLNNGKLEVYRLVDGFYQMLATNERAHYPVAPMEVELGWWQGSYQNQTQLWLRWWDDLGNLLLIGDERAELEG